MSLVAFDSVFILITEKLYLEIIILNSTVKSKTQVWDLTITWVYTSHLDNGYSRSLKHAARDAYWEISNN